MTTRQKLDRALAALRMIVAHGGAAVPLGFDDEDFDLKTLCLNSISVAMAIGSEFAAWEQAEIANDALAEIGE